VPSREIDSLTLSLHDADDELRNSSIEVGRLENELGKCQSDLEESNKEQANAIKSNALAIDELQKCHSDLEESKKQIKDLSQKEPSDADYDTDTPRRAPELIMESMTEFCPRDPTGARIFLEWDKGGKPPWTHRYRWWWFR